MAFYQDVPHAKVDPAGEAANTYCGGQYHADGESKLNRVWINNRFHQEALKERKSRRRCFKRILTVSVKAEKTLIVTSGFDELIPELQRFIRANIQRFIHGF